jgi:hypothetical protein
MAEFDPSFGAAHGSWPTVVAGIVAGTCLEVPWLETREAAEPHLAKLAIQSFEPTYPGIGARYRSMFRALVCCVTFVQKEERD